MGSRQCLKEAFLEHTCAKPPTGRGSCTGSRFQSLILESASSLRTLTGSSSPFSAQNQPKERAWGSGSARASYRNMTGGYHAEVIAIRDRKGTRLNSSH